MKAICLGLLTAWLVVGCRQHEEPPPPTPVHHIDAPIDARDDLADIDRDVAAAIARRHEVLDAAVKNADTQARAAEEAVAKSSLGTPDQRAKTVAAMHESWKDGHSPQGQAMIEAEKTVEDKLHRDVEAAKAGPADARKPAVAQLLQPLVQTSDRATSDAAHQAGTNQLNELVKVAAPVAAFAVCEALGGGPVCGVVASLVSALFGGNEATHSDDIVGIIEDVQRVLSGSCDLSCIQEAASRGHLDEQMIDKIAGALGQATSKSEEIAKIAEIVKERSRVAKEILGCLDAVPRSGDGTEIVKDFALSSKCGVAKRVFGMLDEQLARCNQARSPELAAACMYACRPGASPGEVADCDRLQRTRR